MRHISDHIFFHSTFFYTHMEYWAKYRFASRRGRLVCSSGSIENWFLETDYNDVMQHIEVGGLWWYYRNVIHTSQAESCLYLIWIIVQAEPFNISFVSSWPVLIQTSLELYRLWSVMSNNAFICFSDQHSYFKHGTACHPTCIKYNAWLTVLKRS